MKHVPVVIIGAGATGLAAAFLLEQLGISYLLIDENEDLRSVSRRVLVYKHTLQIYEQLGISEKAISLGNTFNKTAVLVNGKRTQDFTFNDISKFEEPLDFVLAINRKENDQLLYHNCQRKTDSFMWRAVVESFRDNGNEVVVIVKKDEGDKISSETIACDYLLAADGAKSKTRDALGISFSADSADDIFFIAEVEIKSDKEQKEIMACFSDDGFISFFPLGRKNHFRAVGVLPEYVWNISKIKEDTVLKYIQKQAGQPCSFIDYGWQVVSRVTGRPMDFCKKGRVFLAGDAAHASSPIVGQGMNTGIQDVYNLCWKVAMVIKKQADAALLDTYSEERSFMNRSLTTQGEKGDNRDDPVIDLFRKKIVPLLTEHLKVDNKIMEKNFITIFSRNKPVYDQSTLSSGKAGNIMAGELMPWLQITIKDNKGNDTVKVIGNSLEKNIKFLIVTFNIQDEESIAVKSLVKLNPVLKYINIAGTKDNLNTLAIRGFSNSFIAVIRPDFYIGFIDEKFDVQKLKDYFRNNVKLKSLKEIESGAMHG